MNKKQGCYRLLFVNGWRSVCPAIMGPARKTLETCQEATESERAAEEVEIYVTVHWSIVSTESSLSHALPQISAFYIESVVPTVF